MLSQSHSEELDLRRRFCLGVGCSLCMQLNLCIFSGQKMLTCLRVHSIRGRGNGTRWRRWMTWTLRGRTRLSCWGAALCSGATAAATGGPLRTCARTGARAVVTRAAQYLLSVLPICHIKGAHANHSVGQCAWDAYMQGFAVCTDHCNAAYQHCMVATQRTCSTAVMCLRRKVPLSEGSVEADGSLMCGYHGWRWNGDGKAIAIPQVRFYCTL